MQFTSVEIKANVDQKLLDFVDKSLSEAQKSIDTNDVLTVPPCSVSQKSVKSRSDENLIEISEPIKSSNTNSLIGKELIKDEQLSKTNRPPQTMETLIESSKGGCVVNKEPETECEIKIVVKKSFKTEVLAEKKKMSAENYFENIKSVDELDQEIEKERAKLNELRTEKLEISVKQNDQKSSPQLSSKTQYSSLDKDLKDGTSKLANQDQPKKELELISSERPRNRRRKKKIEGKNQHQKVEEIIPVQSINSFKQIHPKPGRSSSVKPDAQLEKKNINFQSSICKIANDDTPVFLKSIIRSAKNQEKTQIKSAVYENSKMKPREEKEKLNDCSNSSSKRTQKLLNHSK